MLAAISARFVNLPANRIDDEIEAALRSVCTSLNVDHSTIYQVSDDPAKMVLTHIFQDPEIPEAPQVLNAAELFPWCLKKIVKNETIYLTDTQKAPSEASVDMASWKRFNIRSALVFPMFTGDDAPIGAWSLNCKLQERCWPEELQTRLRIIADIFANALQRKYTEQKLLDNDVRLKLASQNAHVAFWTINVTSGELWATEQSKELFKFDPNEEPTLQTYMDVIHPDDVSIVQSAIQNVLRTGEDECEYRIIWPDGTVRWMVSHGGLPSSVVDGAKLITGIAYDITERKQAEEELRRRETELRQAQRLAHVGSWTWDPHTGSATWSDEMYQIHGRDPGLPPPSFEDLEHSFTPDSWNRLLSDRDECIRTGRTSTLDLELVRPDGSTRWVSLKAEAEKGADDKLLRIRGTLQDITERKATEQRLREYEQTIEDADEMIAVIDRNYRYVIANQSFLTIRGMTKDEVVGRYMWEVLSQRFFDETVKPHVDRAFSGELVRYEMTFSYPERGPRDMAVSYFPLEGPTRVERVLCILRDITERRKKEEALRESEERFRRVVEHVSDALIVDDVEGRIVFANDQFSQLFGFSREEVHNLTLEDYVAPEYRAELKDRHERRMRGESVPTHFEYQGFRSDHSRMWLEVDVASIHDSAGKLIGTQSALRDITGRKQMEEDLRRRTSELEEAQRIARVGSWTWDPQTDVVTWSDEMIALTGWDSRIPIPTLKEHARFFDDETFRRLNDAVQNTLRTGTPYEVETEGTYPDGRKGWFTNRGEVVRDTFGRITHLRGTVQDITERILAERALRDSEERYRSLVESSHDWIWEVDSDARYTYAGPQCLEILGYRPEEILGKTPFDLMPELEAARVTETFREIARESRPFRLLENVNTRKDGSRVVLETNGVPIFDEHGKCIGYRGMDRNITERKHAEEALVESERKFVTLFRTAPVAMILSTLDGRIQDVNDAFEGTTGHTRQDTIGRTAEELHLWAEPIQREKIRATLLADGHITDLEQRFLKKSGEVRTGLLSSDLIEINGETHLLTAVKDVTEQKIAEKSLRDLSRRLINAQEEERKRIARELHDNISQRLALLSFTIQQIEKSELTDEIRDKVHKLLDDTKLVSSDVQALSHQLHSASLDLLGLAAGIESFRREFAKSHQVTIKFAHSGVPKSIPGELSLALFRITQEALNNAVKYSGAKDFEVVLIGTADQLELTIRDRGVGFEVEAAATRGLGLVSMRERILPLHGTISIVSKPMQGTEITVRIPLGYSEPQSPPIAHPVPVTG